MKLLLKLADILFKTIKIIFLPNHCMTCDRIVNQNQACCEFCLDLFEPINFKFCNKCSYPVDQEVNLCGGCLRANFAFTKNISCFIYNDIVRKIVNDIKNHHNTTGIYFFADFLFADFIKKIPNKTKFSIVTCVPVSAETLFERGFNHSAILAKRFFQNLATYNKRNRIGQKIIFIPDLLIKKHTDKSQKTLTLSERQKNRLNFEVNPKYHNKINKQNIILIDDIATTCSTLDKTSNCLKNFKCLDVLCLTVARVVV